jgi:O-acetyl-ADP-ribose deacetylase (regulator of RNase III)
MVGEQRGNLLEADVDALVNTVNTVGVMGKGIALQFRRAFPSMYKAYQKAAKQGEIKLGRMSVFATGSLSGPRYVINFPTKGHWRARSRLADIEAGLTDLVATLRALEITSVAIPPLGCGNGGLLWSQVRPLIIEAFTELPDVNVILYPPEGSPAASSMVDNTARPKMTVGKAALVDMISRYSEVALETTLIEVQKLMYFLQVGGQDLRLAYTKDRYGPYADNLRHVLRSVEGHFLVGYGDASATVHSAEPISALTDAVAEARALLASEPETLGRIERVMRLIDGFESPYALELLATVHWVATEEPEPAENPDVAATVIAEWSSRKQRMFGPDHVVSAWTRLRDEGWLRQPAAV